MITANLLFVIYYRVGEFVTSEEEDVDVHSVNSKTQIDVDIGNYGNSITIILLIHDSWISVNL